MSAITDAMESVHDEGYKACRDLQAIEDNPYSAISDCVRFVMWRTGWFDYQQMSMEAGGEFPICDEENEGQYYD